MPTVADALAGARYQTPAAHLLKTALLVGAVGRLGERILARLLATPEYRYVYVMAEYAMPSTEPKLRPLTTNEWTFRVDHVIALIGEHAGSGIAGSRNRTEVFSALGPNEILPLAQQAKLLGATSFTLVTPIDIFSQPAALYAQLANLTEAELHQIGFESLLLVRPSDAVLRQRQSGIGKRLIGMLVNTAAGLMVGTRHAPLSMDDTARAIVRATCEQYSGLRIIESDHLHALLQ
jgi:hypothetical protein